MTNEMTPDPLAARYIVDRATLIDAFEAHAWSSPDQMADMVLDGLDQIGVATLDATRPSGDDLVLVRRDTGGVFPDGTTNHPAIDFTAPNEPVRPSEHAGPHCQDGFYRGEGCPVCSTRPSGDEALRANIRTALHVRCQPSGCELEAGYEDDVMAWLDKHALATTSSTPVAACGCTMDAASPGPCPYCHHREHGATGCRVRVPSSTPDVEGHQANEARWAFLDTETGDWIEVVPGTVFTKRQAVKVRDSRS